MAPDKAHSSFFRTRALPLTFAGLVFFPWVLIDLHVMRPAVVIIGIVILLTELRDRDERERVAITLAAAAVFIPAIYFGSIEVGVNRGDPFLTLNIQRGVILLVLFIAAGRRLYDSAYRRHYASAFVLFAALSSVVAFTERILGRSLLGRDESFDAVTRDGQVRAVAGAEHVLVLGTLICIAVAIVSVSGHRLRIPLGILLIVGCWATGSLGPTAIAVLALISGTCKPVARSFAKHQLLYFTGAVAGLILLAYMSIAIWSTTITGMTGRSFSTEYRYALYASIPSILTSHPFGIGLGELPSGVWQFASSGFRTVDLARSVDSELAHLGIMFGVIGVAAFVYLLLVCVRALGSDIQIGLPVAAVCAVGMVLSLHSWDTLTPVWFVGIGLLIRSRQESRHKNAGTSTNKSLKQPVRTARVGSAPLR